MKSNLLPNKLMFLKANFTGGACICEFDTEQDDNAGNRVLVGQGTIEEQNQLAAEIVKRWNEYTQLQAKAELVDELQNRLELLHQHPGLAHKDYNYQCGFLDCLNLAKALTRARQLTEGKDV